jgi:hypothetical protein
VTRKDCGSELQRVERRAEEWSAGAEGRGRGRSSRWERTAESTEYLQTYAPAGSGDKQGGVAGMTDFELDWRVAQKRTVRNGKCTNVPKIAHSRWPC